MSAIYLNSQEVPAIFKSAFPHYTGKHYSVVGTTTVELSDNYWSGGTKYDYMGVNLITNEVVSPTCSEFGNPFVNGKVPTVVLSAGLAIVCHKFYCGKDMGIVIYVHPDNLQKMIAAPVELTKEEGIVIEYTCSRKSSYGGVSNYRFSEATRSTGITLEAWNKAKEACIARGLLDKRGAITVAGRNARQSTR